MARRRETVRLAPRRRAWWRSSTSPTSSAGPSESASTSSDLRAEPAAGPVRGRRAGPARPGGSDTYALDIVSVVESVLEDPRPVLAAQLKPGARTEAIAPMKADGIEYDERMAELDEITSPTPARGAARAHVRPLPRSEPWVAEHRAATQVGRPRALRAGHGLRRLRAVLPHRPQRGTVLRYLSDVYRTLRRTIPEDAKSDELDRAGRLAGRDGPPGGLEPARRVGGARANPTRRPEHPRPSTRRHRR